MRSRVGTKPKWQITVLSRDGQTLLFHAQCEDRVEVRALATEARHRSLSYQILIRDPFGELSTWD